MPDVTSFDKVDIASRHSGTLTTSTTLLSLYSSKNRTEDRILPTLVFRPIILVLIKAMATAKILSQKSYNVPGI
jgi:hypothetical protein